VAELTGVLQADFSDFYSAVTTAEAHLKDFETGAGKVEKSLSRMVDNFSGRKLIQDATLAAEAVERIGGAAKLTDAELERVTAQASEAAKKLRLMGEEVPAKIQALADKSKGLDSAIGGMLPTLGKLAGAFGIVFSVDAVVGFGREVLATADKLTNMAEATRTSVVDLQKMDALAGETGTSLETLVAAVATLQTRLDDPSAQKFLREMNVELSELKAANYYEQFKMIAEGLQRIPDPVRQADAALAIMGPNWKQIIGTLRADIRGIESDTVTATGGAIAALAGLGDAFDRARNNATNFATTGLGGVVIALQALWKEGIPKKWGTVELFNHALGTIMEGFYNAEEAAQRSAAALEKHEGVLSLNTKATRARSDAVNAGLAADEKSISLYNQLFGADLIARATEYRTALGDVSNISKLVPEQQTAMAAAFTKAAEQLERLNKGTTAQSIEFRTLAAAMTPLPDLFKNTNVGLEAMLAALPKVTLELPKLLDPLPLQSATDGWSDHAKATSAAMQAYADVKPEIKGTADETAKATAANQALAASFTVVTKSAQEWRAQAIGLRMDADEMEKRGGGLSTTLWQTQYIENLRSGAKHAEESASRQALLDSRVAGAGAAWGGGGGWTVNVNATQGLNGDQIASELVASMRRRGISPGGL